jgi:hypothetical protein
MASERRWSAWIGGAALVLFAATAHAEPTAADRETARALMQEGRALRDKGDLKSALDRFHGANEIMHVPTTALEVAKVQVSLGLLVEARDTVAAIRQSPEAPNDPEPFKEARAKLLELDAGLEGRVPSITIVVHGAAEGDSPAVAIDGVKVPAAAAKLARSVDPGHHVVTASSSSAEGKQEIDVREGQTASVEVTLVASGATTPAAPAEEASQESAPPSSRSHGPTTLTWIGAGVAGAGVIAGSITGAMVLSKTSQLRGQCPGNVCPSSSFGSLDSTGTLATVSTVSFVVAGVGAGVAIVSLVVGHGTSTPEPAAAPPSAGLHFTPWVGLGSAGVNGSF